MAEALIGDILEMRRATPYAPMAGREELKRFQNSIPAGIVDELAQSLGRRME